ncbi:DUF3574 domain-containing protein [Acetobacter farinalis]|uniref:DUF3574 domain-containing protein n=1 Tax=Acetobacter farinalis TaxID=1260984 RepID=A0ABT3Q945_9PROT|nr:DUF3574 domain-containing protein [Acetobacter farinalis]MCX2561803.1 DUF3574 domain-containing protein [Acetobacter farinalis]
MPGRHALQHWRARRRWGVLAVAAFLLSGCNGAGAPHASDTEKGTPPAARKSDTAASRASLKAGASLDTRSSSDLTLQKIPSLCSPFQTHPMLSITLLFGLSRPNEPDIPEAEWQSFLKTTLTPAFPDGLSVLPAQGQWRDSVTGRTTQESSRLVMLLVEPAPDLAIRLENIRTRYKKRFMQQSVGLVVTPVCAGF